AHGDVGLVPGGTRTGIDALSAGGVEQLDPRGAEHLDVAAALRVAANVLGTELDEALHPVGDPLSLRQRRALHLSVHVHVTALAARTGTTVSDVDAHFLVQFPQWDPVAGIPWRGDHRGNAGQIHI